MVTCSRHIIPLYELKVNITRAITPNLARPFRLGDRFSFDVISLCLAQGEEVGSGLGVEIGVRGAGLAVGDVVGVGVAVGVGVGRGGAGMGMMKRTMLRTMIRLRTPKAIWRVLTCDLREPRFTACLLVGWQLACSPGSLILSSIIP